MVSLGVIRFVFLQAYIHVIFGQVCYPRADTVFLMDGSDSILQSEFMDQKAVILQYSHTVSMLSNDVRVGAQVYSSVNDITSGIDLISSSQISPMLLELLTQPSHGSRLDFEMARIQRTLATTGRQNEAQIAVVFSDGRVENLAATKAAAEDMKASGIYIMTVGVGRNIMKADLQSISSLSLDYRNIKPIKDVVDTIINITTTIGTKWCSRTILPVFTTDPSTAKQVDNGQLQPDAKLHGMGQGTMSQNQSTAQNIQTETQFQDIPPVEFTTMAPQSTQDHQKTVVQKVTSIPPQPVNNPILSQQGSGNDIPIPTQQTIPVQTPIGQQPTNPPQQRTIHQNMNTEFPVLPQPFDFSSNVPTQPQQFGETSINIGQGAHTDISMQSQQHGTNTNMPMITNERTHTDLPVMNNQGVQTDISMANDQGFHTDMPMSPHESFNTDMPMSPGFTTIDPLASQDYTTDMPMTSHDFTTEMLMTSQRSFSTDIPVPSQQGLNPDMSVPSQQSLNTDMPMSPHQPFQTDIPIQQTIPPFADTTITNTFGTSKINQSQSGNQDGSVTQQQIDPSLKDSTNMAYNKDLNQNFQQIDDFSSSGKSTNTLTSDVVDSKTNINSGGTLDLNAGMKIADQQNTGSSKFQNRLVVQPNNEAEVRVLLQLPTPKDKTLSDIFGAGNDQQNTNSPKQELPAQNGVDQFPQSIQMQTGSSGKTIYELVQSLIRMQRQLQRTIDETPEVANNVIMPTINLDQNSGIGKLLKASSAFSSAFEKHVGPTTTQDVHPAYEIMGSPPVSPKAQPPFNLPDISVLDKLMTNSQAVDSNLNLQQQSDVTNQQNLIQQDTMKQIDVVNQINTQVKTQQNNMDVIADNNMNKLSQPAKDQQVTVDSLVNVNGQQQDNSLVQAQNDLASAVNNQHGQITGQQLENINVNQTSLTPVSQNKIPTEVKVPALQVIPDFTFSNDQQPAIPRQQQTSRDGQAGFVDQLANVQKMLKHIPPETASQINAALQNLGITQDQTSSGNIDFSTLDTTQLAGTLKQLNNVLAGQTSGIPQGPTTQIPKQDTVLTTVGPSIDTGFNTAAAVVLTGLSGVSSQQQSETTNITLTAASQIADTLQPTNISSTDSTSQMVETQIGIPDTGNTNTQSAIVQQEPVVNAISPGINVNINADTASQIANVLQNLGGSTDQTVGTGITADAASQIAGTLKELNNVLAVAGQTTLGSDQKTGDVPLDPGTVASQSDSTKSETLTDTGTQSQVVPGSIQNPQDLNKKESINNLINVLQKTSEIITEEIRKTEGQGTKNISTAESQTQKPVQTTIAPITQSPSVVTNIKKIINYQVTSPPTTTPHMYIHPTDGPREPVTNPVLTKNTIQDPNQPPMNIQTLPDGKQDMVQMFSPNQPQNQMLSQEQQALIDSFVKVNSQHQSEEQARHTLEVLTNAIAQAQRQRLISQPTGTNIHQTNVFNTIFNQKEGGISSQSAVNTLQIIADALALLSKSEKLPSAPGSPKGNTLKVDPNTKMGMQQIDQQSQQTTNAVTVTTMMSVVTSNQSLTQPLQQTVSTARSDVKTDVSIGTQQNNFGLQVDPKVTSGQMQTSPPRAITIVTETKTQIPPQTIPPPPKPNPVTTPKSQPTPLPVTIVTVPATQPLPPPVATPQIPLDFVWGQSLSQLTPETGQKPYQISPPVDNVNAADPYVQFPGSLSQSPSNQNGFDRWQGQESTFQFEGDPSLNPPDFQSQFPTYQFSENTQSPHDQTPGQHPGVIVQSVSGESQLSPQSFANNQQPTPPGNIVPPDGRFTNINTANTLNSLGNFQQNQYTNPNQGIENTINTLNQQSQIEFNSGLANFLNDKGSASNKNVYNNVPALQQDIPPAVPLVADVQVPKDVSIQPTPPIRINTPQPVVVVGGTTIDNNILPQNLKPTTLPNNNDQQLPTPVALGATTPLQVPLLSDRTENNLLVNGQTPESKSKITKDNQIIGSEQMTNQVQDILNQKQTTTANVQKVDLVPEQPINLVTDITIQPHSIQNNSQHDNTQEIIQQNNLQPGSVQGTTQQQNPSVLETNQTNEVVQIDTHSNQPKPIQIIELPTQQPDMVTQQQNTTVVQPGQNQENIKPPNTDINTQTTSSIITTETNTPGQVLKNTSETAPKLIQPKFHSTFLMSPEELSRISQQQNRAFNAHTPSSSGASNIIHNGGFFGQIDHLFGGKSVVSSSKNDVSSTQSESIPITSGKIQVTQRPTDKPITTPKPQNTDIAAGGMSLNELLWGPNYRSLMDNYATLEKQKASEATEAARKLQEQRRLEQARLEQQMTTQSQSKQVTQTTGAQTNSFGLGNIFGTTSRVVPTKTIQPVQIRTIQPVSGGRPLSSLKLFDINYPLHVPVIVNGQLVTSKATNRQSVTSSTRSQSVTSTRADQESRIATRTVVLPSTTTGLMKQGKDIEIAKKPVQTQAQRELYDLCLGSQFVNGIAYNAIPSSCHEFVQCFYYEGSIQVEKGRCPFRMHWDQDLLLCRPARFGFCQRDPCLQSGVATYSAGDCRSYYACTNGQPQPKCCPFGMRHEPGVGKCVVDTSCISWCEETGDEYFEKAFPNCRMMPFFTNAGFYFDEIPGVGMMPRMCAGGSTFNPALCVCETPDKIDFDANNQAGMISKCKPEFRLDFTDEFKDLSGNRLPFNHEHVHIERQAAKFEGDGKITIWRFSGGSFGDKVAFTLRFKPTVNWLGSQRMDLLSNCDREGPSVGISVTASNIGGYVSFMANASDSGVTSFDIAYKGDGWNNVTYIYDGKHLVGSVNDVSNTVPLMGTIDQRTNPLSLGSCNFVNNYVGLMDDVRIYLCVPRWLL